MAPPRTSWSKRLTFLLCCGVVLAATEIAGATSEPATRPAVCELVSNIELGTTFHATFAPGRPYVAGSGTTCGYQGSGSMRIVTVRVARGRDGKSVFASTLRALRQVLRDVQAPPPKRIAGLGDRAYSSFDTFIKEASVEVLKGTTFVQVTAALLPGADPGLVDQTAMKALAAKVLARA